MNRFACTALAWSLISVAAFGCEGASSPSAAEEGDAGTGSEGSACPSSGTGTLRITITGLPSGTAAKVDLAGPSGRRSVTASGELSLEGGSLTITGGLVAGVDPIVRPVYEAKPLTACVKDGATVAVDVAYTPVATSNKLWATNQNGEATLLAFASTSLVASGAPMAVLAAQIEAPKGLAFDKEGGMWMVNKDSLEHYPASVIASTEAKVPDVTIAGEALTPGIPGASQIAFDATGNLWVSVVAGDAVLRYDAAQLRTSGSPVPSVKISGVKGAGALAFDAAGNLWIAETGTSRVVEYMASRLNSSTSEPADVALLAESPPPVTVGYQSPLGLAFDAANNLWVNYNGGTFVRFTQADRVTTATLTPEIQIDLAVDALAEGIAFDESGGLWFAYAAGKIARLAPLQLAASSKATPETVLTSPSVNYGNSVAFYPAPATLPLFGKPLL